MTNHTPPDGWVMVPREPTEAMIEAGCRALHELQGTGDADEVAHSPYQSSWDVPDSIRWRQWEETIVGDEGEGGIYRALLAAAPTSAQPISEQSSNCDDVTTTPPLGEGKAVPYGYWIEDGVENGFQRGGLTWGEIATLDANGIKVIPLYASTPPATGEVARIDGEFNAAVLACIKDIEDGFPKTAVKWLRKLLQYPHRTCPRVPATGDVDLTAQPQGLSPAAASLSREVEIVVTHWCSHCGKTSVAERDDSGSIVCPTEGCPSHG